jgi:beta-hydroxylase
MKKAKYAVITLVVLAPAFYFIPLLTLFYLLCGLYDASRNGGPRVEVLRRYFLGNGVLTWLLSPLNVVMDLFALPYINKGVYQLEQLPPQWQAEVTRVIQAARDADLVGRLEARAREHKRAMFFFRWYGADISSVIDVPAFREPWSYVQTIGVSVFNKRVSTSRHFGPLRSTLRVLYNLNDFHERSAYITVGDRTNYWCENKLFIFDDTLLHESHNQTDTPRYCLFVDIIRPASLTFLLVSTVRLVCVGFQSLNFLFYRHWKVIDR